MNNLLPFGSFDLNDEQRKLLTVHLRRAMLEEYVKIQKDGRLEDANYACNRLAHAIVSFFAGEHDYDAPLPF